MNLPRMLQFEPSPLGMLEPQIPDSVLVHEVFVGHSFGIACTTRNMENWRSSAHNNNNNMSGANQAPAPTTHGSHIFGALCIEMAFLVVFEHLPPRDMISVMLADLLRLDVVLRRKFSKVRVVVELISKGICVESVIIVAIYTKRRGVWARVGDNTIAQLLSH